jgi:beta-glucosidase
VNTQIGTQNPATTENVGVSVTVRNAGQVAGDEVAQVYLVRPGDGGQPMKTLAGFKRVRLQPGEQKTIDFTITPLQFSVVTAEGQRRVQPGAVAIHVGGSSAAGAAGQVTIRGGVVEPAFGYVAPKVREGAGP